VRRLKARLAQILQEQNVPYLDGANDFPVDNPQLFADSNHLSTEGRSLFTEMAARFIAHAQQSMVEAKSGGLSTALAAP
jgi:lysophospholipase L1-like esterase